MIAPKPDAEPLIVSNKKYKREQATVKHAQQPLQQQVEAAEAAQPKPRQFVPKQCTCCTALAEGKGYTRVYATRWEAGSLVRYCRCSFCGATSKQTGN